MKKNPITYLSLGLTAGALFLTACSKPAEDSEASSAAAEVTIPDAPDEAMKAIFAELSNGNGGILWKAMPASYQGDVNKVVQLAGSKVDAELYDQAMGLVGRIGQVAGKQQDYILNSTLLPEADPEEQESMSQLIPVIVELLDVITTSEIGTSAELQSFEGQKFFDTTVSKIMKLGFKLSAIDDSSQPTLEDLGKSEFTVVEQSETAATVKMVAADEEEMVELVKVENRWVPEEMADEWATNMSEAVAQLEAITPEEINEQKPQIMSVLAMLDGVLTQIEAAESQQQFDQAIQGATMPIMGLMMMGQGMGGSGPAMPMPQMPTAP